MWVSRNTVSEWKPRREKESLIVFNTFTQSSSCVMWHWIDLPDFIFQIFVWCSSQQLFSCVMILCWAFLDVKLEFGDINKFVNFDEFKYRFISVYFRMVKNSKIKSYIKTWKAIEALAWPFRNQKSKITREKIARKPWLVLWYKRWVLTRGSFLNLRYGLSPYLSNRKA